MTCEVSKRTSRIDVGACARDAGWCNYLIADGRSCSSSSGTYYLVQLLKPISFVDTHSYAARAIGAFN